MHDTELATKWENMMNQHSRINAVINKPHVIDAKGAHDIFDRLADHERLLTVKELSGILSISHKTVYSYVARNMIPYIKIQSSVRFRPKHIASWLSQRDFYFS
jgi:excisionase family DNA binding protein